MYFAMLGTLASNSLLFSNYEPNVKAMHFTAIIIIIIIIIIIALSPLCRVFTITYVKQTVLLQYRVLWQLRIYNLWYMQCYFGC
jgi:hypothetical protein